MDDPDLLAAYARDHAPAVFDELVRRHRDWVYSVCLRRLRDPALAEDAAQAVFLALLKKAPQLSARQPVVGWLHTASRYAASRLLRAQARRAHHEAEAAAMRNTPAPAPDTEWLDLSPRLETAMDALSAGDRQAILLRFYRQLSHAEIAAALHLSEEAAKKRVARALDRLRTLLKRRGVTTSASVLAAALLAHAVSRAPAAVAAQLSALTTASTLPAKIHLLTKGVLHMMLRAKLTVAATLTALLITAAAIAAPLISHPPAAASATAPATTSALADARQHELDAINRVLAAIDSQIQVGRTTPEISQSRVDWLTRRLRLVAETTPSQTLRELAAAAYLKDVQGYVDNLHARFTVGQVTPEDMAIADVCLAHAQVLVERIKAGETRID